MNRRLVGLGTAGLALLLIAAPLVAQSPSVNTKAVPTDLATPVKGFTQPKTEWGDPDISGVWTSDAALGIPRERPEKFGDRAFLNDQEFADAQKADRSRVGSRERDWGVPQRRRVEEQVLPADLARHRARGRAHTGLHGRGAEARRAARSRQLRRGTVRDPARLHALRPLHHPRHRRLGDAGRVRQRQPHRAGAGHGGHQLRDGARHARHLHRRPAASRRASGSGSATPAGIGKATRWSSKRRTSRTRPASAAAMATGCGTAPR